MKKYIATSTRTGKKYIATPIGKRGSFVKAKRTPNVRRTA